MRSKSLALVGALLLAGCSSGGESASDPSVDAGGADAATGTPRDDAAAPELDAGDVPDVTQPVDSGRVDEAHDAGTTATPDAGSDAGAVDARPCVASIDVPASPSWTIWVTYRLSAETTQSVPYQCPGTVEGNSCKFALGGGPQAYLAPGTCRYAVPAKCLPCTAGVASW